MTQRRCKVLVAISMALLVAVGAPRTGHAQTSAAANSSKIATITVTGASNFTPEQILAAAKLQPGDTVTAEQIQAATNFLADIGVFNTVRYRYEPRGDGIALEFAVEEAPTVPAWYDNFPRFTQQEMTAAIRERVVLFSGEAPESGNLLGEIDAALEALLATRNVQAGVTHELVAAPTGDGMVMQFRANGPSLKIQSLEFGDPLAANSERLKDRLSDVTGQPYSRFALEVFVEEQVKPLYIAQGHLRAQFGPPQAKVSGATADSAGAGVAVLLPIIPGPVYTWGGATWQGNTILPASSLDTLLEIKQGEVADGVKIAAMWQHIKSAYDTKGYLDAKLDAQPQFDEAVGRVAYQVRIQEGYQYRMGKLIITGLSLDAEQRLVKAWAIQPGAIFDKVYFDRLLGVLSTPSRDIFGDLPVHYKQVGDWLRPDTVRHTVDVLLDFK